MRVRRAIGIAGGVVTLAVGVLLLMREPGRVSAQVLSETNGYRTVVIRNGTPHLYHVLAWGEFYSNDAWERLSLSNTFDKVEPGRFIATQVLMPTNSPRRLAFVYRPVRAGPIAVWINRIKTRLRLKPEVEHVYVEVE
jgi:hypothetical protein